MDECYRRAWLTLGLGLEVELEDLAAGYGCAELNLGWPEARDEVYPLPDRDGVADYTRLMGARTITAHLTAWGGRRGIDDIARRFAPFIVPSARPVLHVILDDNVERVIALRASAFSAPITGPYHREITLGWTAPDPRFYDLHERNLTVLPPAPLSAGREYDLAFDRTYPEAYGGSGVITVPSGGDVDTWPTFRIYGPFTDPRITNLDTDEALAFNIAIDQRDYLVVDTAERAVYLDDDPEADRYANVDVARTTWFPIRRGFNRLRLTGAAYITPAQARITWTDAYL
jgi:hypothetical protein